MKLKDCVALVTGGGGGLGGAAAKVMAQEGAKVIVTDVADPAGTALAKEIGGTYYHHDVASEADWQAIVSDVIKCHGRIDVLLNSAGIEGDLTKGGALNTSFEDWRRVMSVNLDGTFLGCRSVVPYMINQGTGSVINIASIASFMATSTAIAYGASKAGVQQLTKSIAWIGAQDGKRVRCNSVHPGIIRTRMTDNIFRETAQSTGLSESEVEAMICSAVPFGTRGMPSDVAALVLYLASHDSRYVTGSEFKVDGGWLLVNAS